MHRKVLLGLTLAAFTVAPAIAKTKAAAPSPPPSAGPIPYSELAAADAKLNGAGAKAKHHTARKKADAAKADPKPANS